MAKYKTLQNPWAEGLGNDYEQNLDYVSVTKTNKITGKEESSWRDGIYTKLAFDIKDPEGYNKRTVNIPQSAWGTAADIETIKAGNGTSLNGETDASALFTPSAYGAVSFGQPFDQGLVKYAEVFEADPADYYADEDKVKIPQGIDVASFRKVENTSEEA